MEKAIRILFSRCDMSLVKKYVLHQCRMLIEGSVAVNDYVIAKEYRGKSTYKTGACVPALEITKYYLYNFSHTLVVMVIFGLCINPIKYSYLSIYMYLLVTFTVLA